jgi:uncharacterized protein YbaP (TraB family)
MIRPIKLCWLLFCLLSVVSVQAQAPRSSLLWEITGNGLTQPSYIFGTYHVICRNDFPVSEILKQKITNSGQFYGELAMDDPGLQMQIMTKMILTGNTLSSLMGEADYAKASASFQKITGLPLSMFNNFKPFVPLTMAIVRTSDCEDVLQPDIEFMGLAKEKKIPILGLETADDQINAINSEPLDSQVTALKQILLNFDSVKHETNNIIAVYKTRNIDSLIAFMRTRGTDSEFEQNLIIKRNRNWIPVIEKAVALKPSFFAVGAGHLGGEEGVIALLRKKGYVVKPIAY